MSDHYNSKELNHLGLVSGMVDELLLVETIDSLLPQDLGQRHVSIGVAVKALILNGLGFTQRRLYLVPSFFSDKPTEELLGKGVQASHLNDTVLGRALDALYDYGCTDLFSRLSASACSILGLASEFGHLDSTSFHLHGEYNSSTPPTELEMLIHITKGYSRDHHPELNQVILNLIAENRAGIPMHMEALSGNSDDKTSFRVTVENHIDQLQNVHGIKYLVADSAFYTSQNLCALSHKTCWISRVPETIMECKTVIKDIKVDQMIRYDDNYKFQHVCSTYAGIKQRWLLVWSSHAYSREKKTLEKNFGKQSEKEMKRFYKLTNKEFACSSDAKQAFDEFHASCKYIEITDDQVLTHYQYNSKGRPKKGKTPDKTVYKIQGTVSSSIQVYQEMLETKGKFILATNELDMEKLPDSRLFAEYKNQGKVERGFRFIKDPQFMASTFFVQKPERVEAILMIMTLCLLVYAALEHKLRQELEEQDQTIPNQLGKPIKNPTMRWVFALFAGIHMLYINKDDQHQTMCLNRRPIHDQILSLLGSNFIKYYASP